MTQAQQYLASKCTKAPVHGHSVKLLDDGIDVGSRLGLSQLWLIVDPFEPLDGVIDCFSVCLRVSVSGEQFQEGTPTAQLPAERLLVTSHLVGRLAVADL